MISLSDLYNILTIDAIVQQEELPTSTSSINSFWRTYAYQVNGNNLTLDTIEHGLLRGELL